ncbi:hypothetical protein [Treponema pedis]|uniref:hypothetical protein n=1 Tax=Treponema pedis TaxID=409322 RepID=UPI001FD390BC|nr:hypothetical protein [Treponema pedis]
MAEDLLIYFFILLHAADSRYYGTEDIVYTYCLGRGISSNREITSLDQWERACSAASVFTIIFSHLEEHPLTVPNAEKILVSLKDLCRSHMKMNLNHLQRVSPALQPEAKKILCEYWGEGIDC